MGCSGSGSVGPTLTLEEELEMQKRNIMSQIEEDRFKITVYENDLVRYNKEINDGENDLKINGFQLTEVEKNYRFDKLMELQKDRARVQRSLDSLKVLNEQLKNNLESIQKKIDEQRVAQRYKEGRDLFNKVEKENNNEVINSNYEYIMAQKQRDEKNKKNIERMNRSFICNDVINEDDYRRKLGMGIGTKPGY